MDITNTQRHLTRRRLEWALGAMILEIPATLLQLIGALPNPYPTWYSLCRMGISLLAILIAVWMFSIYRRYGVWARGRKKTL